MAIALAPERQQFYFPKCSAEHRLILACARCQPDEALINRVLDDCESALDWASIIQTANWHGVLPLVYRNLSGIVPDRVPKAVLGQLMKRYLTNSIHNQRLTSTLQELVELFRSRSIPIMFFKGPVLAEIAYSSIHLRRFSDIDMLVREGDVPAVRQILIEQGFQTKELILAAMQKEDSGSAAQPSWNRSLSPPETLANVSLAKAEMRHSGEEMFIHKQSSVTVDLHWQLMPNYFPVAFDLDRIWLARQPFIVDRTELESFNPQDLLLYLCAHGSKELWRNLIWVCDVAEVVRVYPDLPWLDLWQTAKTLGIERMFLVGLALAHELLDMPLPQPLQDPVLHRAAIQDLLEIFKRRIFTDIDTLIEHQETGFWLFHNPLHLKLRDRLRDRMPQYWLTLRFIVTPNAEDRQFLNLPKALYLLHYLVRPIRILFKWMMLRKQSTPLKN
ncbi:nucleotidyltransferase family protein [Altericista sp. CCNU0014]|uniref:nucleotidyltransferase domain-containing protein n=1 Tax=Altericista sp. CCNU0014 TaxID=3082949 RepID=UPI003850D1BC